MTVKVREIKPGKWYVVVHYGGRRIMQLVHEGREAAERYANELRREISFRGYGALQALRAEESGLTLFKNYAAKWIAEIEKSELKKSTVISYKSNVKYHLLPAFGHMRLADITYTRVKEFAMDKQEGGYSTARFQKTRTGEPAAGERRKYSRDSIRIMLATLRAMLDEALTEKLIDANPVYRMGKWYRKARPLREDPDPFSLGELHQVEAACRERWPEWYEFILFMGRTGVRIGEAIAMQTADLDLEQQQAVIRRNMPIHRELGTPKSIASARTVDLSPQLVEGLKSRILRRKTADLAAGVLEGSEWLFATSQGNPPDYSRFTKAWNRIQARAKVRRRRPHDLRHTYATLNLIAGKPLAYVSAQLGHKSQEITLRIYAHWIKGTSSGAADNLDEKKDEKRATWESKSEK